MGMIACPGIALYSMGIMASRARCCRGQMAAMPAITGKILLETLIIQYTCPVVTPVTECIILIDFHGIIIGLITLPQDRGIE
jgi:hypothetical protein